MAGRRTAQVTPLGHVTTQVYDTAGRIRKGPAPENMYIPPYAFISDNKIKIG